MLDFVPCSAGCGTRYVVTRYSTVPADQLDGWLCPRCEHDTDPHVVALQLVRLGRRLRRAAA